MKYLDKYNKITEGLRNLMKPSSEDNIIDALKDYHPDEKLLNGIDYQSIKVIKLSIEEGANLGRRGLLNKVVRSENIEMIKFLLDNYYDDLDIDVDEMQSALQYMVLSDNLDIIKILEKFNITIKPDSYTYNTIKNCIERERSKKTINHLVENYIFVKNYINFEISEIETELKKWKEYEK